MPNSVIDACSLIDLLASGEAEAILRSVGFTWFLPSAVQNEVRYCRQYDPANPGKVVSVPADLTGLISTGLLTICSPQDQAETNRFTQYATVFRSDGESMCLAIAETRGWSLATDDRKAIRIAKQAGIPVVSSPELVKAWSASAQIQPAALRQVLKDIQFLAHFKPNAAMPESKWWLDELAKSP